MISVSFVLLAWNEEASIGDAIRECRAFGRAHCEAHQVIVVDDGSRDGTRAVAEAEGAREGDVTVVVHERNRGMGASMRDGYLAATMDYVAHLPGDRQVRADALREMVARVDADTIAISTFSNPPSGRSRAVMSLVFRALARGVGGFRVNFAGTYLFHKDWLRRIPHERAASDTFLYSFQLLELFRRAGARFVYVKVPTYPREQGVSREATVGRIARMFIEIGKARV